MQFDIEQALGGSGSKSGAFGFDVDEALGKKKKRERTWGEAATDTAVQLAEGVNTIAGAIPNLVAPESDTAEFFNRNADFWREQQSEPIKARIAQADQAIDKAGEDGVISQIAEAAGQYFSDPVLAARFVTTNLPSMIPGLAATKLTHAAALARGASAARAASIATTAGGATNAVLNAGGARGEAFEDIKRTLEAQGYSPEQAEQIALSDSRVSAAVGAVAGFVSGKTGLEGSIAGKAGATGARGALRAAAGATAAELAGEQIEEVTPKLTTNAMASEYDNRSIGKDLGRTIVETAIGSGPGSIIAGGASAMDVRRNAEQVSAGVPSITNPSGPTAEGEEIRIEPSRQPGDKPLTQGRQMRPEARLAELEMVQLNRPLNEGEIAEAQSLLREIQTKDSNGLTDPAQPSPADQALQSAAAQDPAQASSAAASPALAAAPAPADVAAAEGVDLQAQPAGPSIAPEDEPQSGAAPVTDAAPTNFWSFARTKGFTPGQLKVGTPEHTALKTEYDALRAGRQVARAQATATAPVQSQVNPASILPINTPNRNATQAPETFQAEAQGTQTAAPTLSPTAAPAQLPAGIDPALQNRDRSRAASVAQMADIARNPDYMRLATSRTPDAGAPMVFAVGDDITSIPEGNEGRTDVAVMADGQRVPFRYAVVDARTVQPSNFADGRVNPAFGAEVMGTIKALNNGRTAGLRAAYEQGTAGNYQAELIADAAAHGVPVEAIQRTPNPILVRVYSERSNTPDMAAKSQGQGLGMSPAELARQDAPLFDAAVLTAYQPGDVTSAANRDFVRAFVGKLSQAGQDVAGMMTAEGSLSPAGRQRIQAGLMQAAYGDADLVAELFDSLDTDIKAIGEALKAVAGEWANMRDSARQGLINPEADITDNLLQAVNLVRKARRENTSLLDLVNQPDLMTGETPDELTVGALRFFYPSPYMTRAAGREAIVNVLRDYTRNAMGTTAGADMFGQVVTPSDILNGITEQGATNAQDPAQEGSRGTDGRRTDGRGPEAPGQGDQQSGADRPGRGTGADRAGERENTAGPAGAGNAQAQEGDEAGRLTERINALRREALPIVRTEAYTKNGITFRQDGERTTVLFKGEPIATLEGKRTRDSIVKAIEGTLAQPGRQDVSEAGSDEIGAQWNRMTTVEREGLARRAGLNEKAAKNVAARGWQGMDRVVQERLAKGFKAPKVKTAAAERDAGQFPSIETVTNLSAGPGGVMTPRPIAQGRNLYRETNVSGLDDLLRLDGQADVTGFYVTDNPDLALGQGDNRGVQVVFRADSLSGSENRKPMTGDTAGREYKTDMVAPRAVQTITIKAVDVVRLRGLTRRALADFDKEVLGDGLVRYHRKGLPRYEAAEPILTNPTRDDVLARQEAVEAAQREAEAADRRAIEAENKRRERDEIRRRSEAAADTFELGQDPMSNLTGQRDVFADADQQEPTPTTGRSRQATADERIQDVGQQLYANRRNFTGRGLKWEDVEGLNDTLKIKEVTKAKVWPRPNYEQLVADGMPPVLARMVKHVYDGLSAGPTIKTGTPPTDADLKRYIDTLAKVREGLFGFINDRQLVADFAKGVLTMVRGEPTALGPVSILDMAKQDMDAREISLVLLRRVWPDQFAANVPTMGRFTRGSEAQKDASIIGGNKALGAMQFGRDDLRKWIADLGKNWPAKREAWQVQGYRVLAPGEYTSAGQEQPDGTIRMIIRPKEGRGSWRTVFTYAQMTNPPYLLVQDGGFGAEVFTTQEAATEAAREKVKRAPGAGQDLRGTNIEDAERTGPARRQDGEDITPQRLMDAFGFRGVNFGREGWIKQAERQAYLNQAYDGLTDLAEILNVPPKAMSLDGKLGIAFGAQGKGGGFAAHFVPGYNEINLTKTRGAGTLAHEWGHALDHHFATLAGLDKDAEPYMSEHGSKPDTTNRVVFEDGKYVNKKDIPTFGDGIRPEIVRAFRSIYQAMEKRNESPGEMAARRDAAKESALKRLGGWIKAARRAIEESPAENKADLLAEFDQHAEKLREGDTGDGYQKAGKQVFSARVAAVRNLIKDATGRMWSTDETNGLEQNASYVKSLLGKQDADTTHEPQKVATQYKGDSLAMDREKGGKAYWSTPAEMFARAFELYVHDKLSQREQTNTFLTDAQQRASTPVQIADSTSATARGAGSTRDLYLYPVGKEREALRESFDNLVGQIKTKETDKGLMLYEPEGIAYTGERNGRTDRQAAEPAGSARAGTSPTDTVRGERGAVPGRARITGLGISADIERAGSAALIGRTVSSADELADLAQVYRDPRYETFRVFFTRSNRILHANGVSARLPGQTPMIPAGMSESDYIQAFKDQMADTGADGYYILHNHPSGDPTPSRDDQRVTEYLAAQVPGMKAHVVINSNRYAVIRPGEAVEVKDKDFGDDLLRIPSLPSPILNAPISKPDDLVTLGKSLQKPGWLTLIGTDSTGKVRLTADVPAAALSRDSRVLAGQVRRLMRQSGSRSMYLVGSDADVASQPVRKALSQGILRDAVGTSGRTQAERGLGGQSDGFNQTPGRFLAEPGDDNYQRDSIGSNPPPQPGPDQQNLWTQAKAKVMQLTSPAAIDRLIYEFQDKYIDLKRLRDHIKSIGGTITDLNDAYLGEELYHKRLAKRTEDFLDKELKPLLADMRSRSMALPELEHYLHARHAVEANRVLAQRNPNRAMIDAGKAESARAVRDLELKMQRAKANGSATKAIEEALAMAREEAATWNGAQAFRGTEDERLALSGMTDAEAKAFMASLTPRQRQNFQELAERVDAIQSKTLKTLEGYGLMDKATLTAWRDTYQFYVPLHRDEAGPESDRHPIGQGFSVKGTGIKSRVGSNEKVTNILAHIAMQRETALTRGEKNHVVKKLYLMAAQNPDREFWEIDQPPMTKTIDPRTGFVRTGIDPTYKNKPNVVMVRIAGRDQAIVFNEQNPQAVRLAEAMKNLDVGDLHVVLGLAAKGTRWFASVNTQYNPIFGLINFARDVQAGLLNLSTTELAGKQKEVASHVMTAMRAIYRERRGKGAVNQQWTQLWDEFQDVGGTTGYRDLFADAKDRANALGKQLAALDRGEVSKAAHAVVDWLSDYNETMENAVRLAAYKVALEQGMTKERAASLAKNITVNFNRKGRQAREIGALYAFFNAALQGTARMVETLRGPVGKRIMYGGVMLGVVNTLIGMAMMGADDDDEADNWEQIPEFIKERSIVIPLGREDYVTIPMPLGFHVFPNIGRIATEYALGDSEKSLGRQVGKLLLAITDAFNPLGGSQNLGQLVAPTVIDPVVALMQNRDWTGKPIYRENSNGLDPQPGHRMAKDSASTPSRIVAEAINRITGGTEYRPGAWSPTPDQLDYVIGQLTGGLGRELLKVNQSIAAPFTGDELPPYKIPLVGRLYGNTRGPAGQSERFYDNIKLLNEIENEYKGRLRNQEDVEELRNSEPLLPLVPMANQYENHIRKLRNLRRQIVERKEDGYQARAREIDQQIGAAMADLNKAISKARKEAVE